MLAHWTAPLLLRLHDVSATEVGMYIGLGSALGGLLGVTLGGIVGDKLKKKHPAGRLAVCFIYGGNFRQHVSQQRGILSILQLMIISGYSYHTLARLRLRQL